MFAQWTLKGQKHIVTLYSVKQGKLWGKVKYPRACETPPQTNLCTRNQHFYNTGDAAGHSHPSLPLRILGLLSPSHVDARSPLPHIAGLTLRKNTGSRGLRWARVVVDGISDLPRLLFSGEFTKDIPLVAVNWRSALTPPT